MAFGLAMPGWAAHLGLAQEAERLVLRLARSYVLLSMVATHNCHDLLNVDIGGGFPALIAEMPVHVELRSPVRQHLSVRCRGSAALPGRWTRPLWSASNWAGAPRSCSACRESNDAAVHDDDGSATRPVSPCGSTLVSGSCDATVRPAAGSAART